MCGIFGSISTSEVSLSDIKILARHSEQRGKDSSGYFCHDIDKYMLVKATNPISELIKKNKPPLTKFIMGHSRLITDGLSDNQPVYRDDICVIHNGIVVNHEELWDEIDLERTLEIDTEIISGIAASMLVDTVDLSEELINEIPKQILKKCSGVVACAIALPKYGKLLLFSNNGSLYYGSKNSEIFFSSEYYPLTDIGCENIEQIRNSISFDIPSSNRKVETVEIKNKERNLVPCLGVNLGEEKLLEHQINDLKRCSKCILPETMPYIRFNSEGVCNYCTTYKSRNTPKPKEELFNLIEPYRRLNASDCIVPFSGGRDSCYGLHLIAKELKMNPITYTYDWGMVTDLGRRNISRMCAELGVENIIVADDISLKRKNINKNLTAWLKSPHLGMISILTAGDKHFFRHVETVKKQTGISLNLWGVNPLEVTHFKAGFLGVPPDFEEERVYSHGTMKQLRYQYLRLKAMSHSLGYFNSSIWDTISGEYYRSFTKKSDYYHIFDYWRWDEKIVDNTLDSYNWEKAPDTSTTWRIGDGTAAFYNYIYYTVAGFTEHDTFRSNQIREGDLTRDEAILLVENENQPRYPNIKWYLDAVDLDFNSVINTVNKIPKIF